jgi:hypothetical protein
MWTITPVYNFGHRQGDKIRRIFASCVIVYLWQFFENERSSPIFGYYFHSMFCFC